MYISSLYSLDRGLLLTLIVTDKDYCRNSRPQLFVYTRFHYCLSTSNSNMYFRLRGCFPKFVLSTVITIWLIHAKYWSHRIPNICSSFHRIISKVVSTLLLDWDCLIDIDYGAHDFTPDVLVVRVVCSVSVFSAQYLWIVLGHVIFTFYNLFVILYWFITFGHVVVLSEFILYTNIIFVDTHLNTEYIVTGFEILLFGHLQWK
jgi:hypothetical protein